MSSASLDVHDKMLRCPKEMSKWLLSICVIKLSRIDESGASASSSFLLQKLLVAREKK